MEGIPGMTDISFIITIYNYLTSKEYNIYNNFPIKTLKLDKMTRN